MFDQKLVEHCSAVLAGLKTANLFSYTVDPGDDVRQLVTFSKKRIKTRLFMSAVPADYRPIFSGSV